MFRFFPNQIKWILLMVLMILMTRAAGLQATPPAIIISGPTTTDAEELSIAINPLDPEILAAGANINYHFGSDDGGMTWSENRLGSTLGVWGDPCLVFDAQGNLYYSHLSNPAAGSWLDRIVVQKSTDNGESWSDGTGVGLNPPKDQDKSWLTADCTFSPHRNNLYLAWTEFDSYGSPSAADSTRILCSRSLDGNQSWSEPVIVSDRSGNCIDENETVEGATPAVGPDGQLYMAWSGHEKIYFDRSLDGGQTFGTDIIVCDQPGGWAFSVPGVWRCNGMPITVCDVSDGPYRGRIYVVFSDQRHGTDDTDIFICTSDDQGQSWTAPHRVNDDLGSSQQFLPWLSVDPVSGTVAVVYYDRSQTNGAATDVRLAVSSNGGESFSSSLLSEAPFTPWDSVFFGDYIGIDSQDGIICTAWMSMDQGLLTVWMARSTFLSGVEGQLQSQTSLVMQAPSVTSSSNTRIAFETFDDGPVQLSVFDLRGRLVRNLVSDSRAAGRYSETWDGRDNTGRQAASGMFLLHLRSGVHEVVRKLVLAR